MSARYSMEELEAIRAQEREQHDGAELERDGQELEEPAGAELEDTTGESDQQPAQEPQEEQPPAELAEAMAIDTKALEKALKAHERAIGKVMGEAMADLAACPTCDGVGFMPAAALAEPELRQDPTTEACPVCDGRSIVATGAKPPGQTERPCTNCAGGGYITKAVELEPPAPFAQQAAGTNGMAGPPAPPAVPAAELDRLRALGYTVIEPYAPPTTPPA